MRIGRSLVGIWLGFVGAAVAVDWHGHPGWRNASGYESEEIARSLAAGRGFSFAVPSYGASVAPAGNAAPTAWKEPLYPAFMALAFRGAGHDRGRTLVAVSQAVTLALTAPAVALVGHRLFGPTTGLVAGTILVLTPSVRANARWSLDAGPAAALWVCLSALAILAWARSPTSGRSVALGAGLGAGMLLHAGTMLFPAVALLALLRSGVPRRRAGRAAAAMLVATALVVAPWTLRNWKTFHAFVPVRTGLGLNLFFGNPLLAETFVPEWNACPGAGPPPFTTAGPRASLLRLQEPDGLRLAYRRLGACMTRSVPGWATMDEVRRDAAYTRLAAAFALAEPRLALRLTAGKALAVLFDLGDRWVRWLTILALPGALLACVRRDAWVVPALAATFALSAVVGLPVFYRYRCPVEPLVALLAAHALASAVARGRRLGGSPAPRAGSP